MNIYPSEKDIVSVKVKVLVICVQLFVTPWTVAHQASLSMKFSRQEYWSGLPFPSPGDLPDPGIEPRSPSLQADSLPSEPPGKFMNIKIKVVYDQEHHTQVTGSGPEWPVWIFSPNLLSSGDIPVDILEEFYFSAASLLWGRTTMIHQHLNLLTIHTCEKWNS